MGAILTPWHCQCHPEHSTAPHRIPTFLVHGVLLLSALRNPLVGPEIAQPCFPCLLTGTTISHLLGVEWMEIPLWHASQQLPRAHSILSCFMRETNIQKGLLLEAPSRMRLY